MKVLFVINPHSGRKDQDNLEKLIKDEVTKLKLDHRIYLMGSGDQEKKIRKEIESFNPEMLACAGGDGTVSLMAKILAETPVTLLIIPNGSANGMAKELGIGSRIDSAISLLGDGVRRKIDLLVINGRTCIHLADVGLNARIVKRFDQDPKRGISTYAKHLMAEIFLIKQYRFYIMYDDKEIKRKAVSLTFANASRYGTGAVINPNGKLDDGQFEVVIVKPFPRIKLFSIAWKMFRGTLQTSEYVEVIRCSKADIRSSKRTTLQVDGEVIGKVNEITIRLLPQALSVLVPPKSN
ncbi:MAG TPA: diacylglycerol kinase [Sphingobacteriaceae bacterium]|nr:diacylglycerol kinase [Sphingobacteriaceae bacterium]